MENEITGFHAAQRFIEPQNHQRFVSTPVPLAMLPVIFLATLAKGYVLPIGAALLYLVPVVLIPSGIMGLHPLASVMGIYPYISSDAAEMVKKWAGGIEITISPNICLISLLVIGSISAIASVLALRKQTY